MHEQLVLVGYLLGLHCVVVGPRQWRRQDFVTGGGVRYGSIGGLEYEVPQSRWYCLCINVSLCSTALQCICRVIRRSSMTMKAHTYYIIFGRPPIGGSFPLLHLAAPLVLGGRERHVSCGASPLIRRQIAADYGN